MSQLAGDRSVRVHARAKISGLAKNVSKAQTFYGVLLCDALFSKFELVAKALQSPSLSASAAEKCVQLLLAQLQDLRSDEFASELHRKGIEKATTLNLELPKAQRSSTVNAPARFSHGAQSRYEEQLTTDVIWKKSHFEAIDHSVAELQRRFNQEGLHKIASTEAILIGSCNPQVMQPH